MPMPIEPLAVLRDFRADLYLCLGRRRDALFDLGMRCSPAARCCRPRT